MITAIIYNQLAFTQSNCFRISFAVGLHILLVRSARIHLQHCHHECWHAKTFYSFRRHSEDPPFAPQHLRTNNSWVKWILVSTPELGIPKVLSDLNWLIILSKSSFMAFRWRFGDTWWYTLYQLADSWQSSIAIGPLWPCYYPLPVNCSEYAEG